MDAAIKKYALIAKEFADEKIKCFTEKVTPVKKIDIEFICADNAAHESIEKALADALGNEYTCA